MLLRGSLAARLQGRSRRRLQCASSQRCAADAIPLPRCEPRVPLSACARACAHRACTHTLARSCTHDRTQDEEDEEWEASQPDVTEDGDSEQVDTVRTHALSCMLTRLHACMRASNHTQMNTQTHARICASMCADAEVAPYRRRARPSDARLLSVCIWSNCTHARTAPHCTRVTRCHASRADRALRQRASCTGRPR